MWVVSGLCSDGMSVGVVVDAYRLVVYAAVFVFCRCSTREFYYVPIVGGVRCVLPPCCLDSRLGFVSVLFASVCVFPKCGWSCMWMLPALLSRLQTWFCFGAFRVGLCISQMWVVLYVASRLVV